ncbi:MAG: hypothetical protein HZA54_19910 [Planctomycetes bacterium]|nr:hypothetical protein [Planctomycetota bacterium]
MIFLDTNLFVIDLRYPQDANYRDNRRFLERVRKAGTGATGLVNLLELCGILSFNLSPRQLEELFFHFSERYGVGVLPDGGVESRLPAPSARRLLDKMQSRMGLKDAEIALFAEEQAPTPEAFVTWNAKHFVGRLCFPALSPREWLKGRKA